jgi:hypothetical protein
LTSAECPIAGPINFEFCFIAASMIDVLPIPASTSAECPIAGPINFEFCFIAASMIDVLPIIEEVCAAARATPELTTLKLSIACLMGLKLSIEPRG